MKTNFVGGGNMAQAIIGGLIAKGAAPTDICIIEPFSEARAALDKFGVNILPKFEPSFIVADTIVLAVKPQIMQEAISPLRGLLRAQTVVSIAAGIRIADMVRWLSDESTSFRKVVRAMPNTPALIQSGITGLFATPDVDEHGRQAAEKLLAAVGSTFWVQNEELLDAVTAVSGSGPAYVFYFIEALEESARSLGLDDALSRRLAIETYLGGARLAASTHDAPALLRQRVTSKRGTTESAISEFDRAGLKSSFIKGVKAACERAHELGGELGKDR